MSNHLALTFGGHPEQILHTFGYIKIHKKTILIFYCGYPIISPNFFKEYYWFYLDRGKKEAIPTNITVVEQKKFM